MKYWQKIDSPSIHCSNPDIDFLCNKLEIEYNAFLKEGEVGPAISIGDIIRITLQNVVAETYDEADERHFYEGIENIDIELDVFTSGKLEVEFMRMEGDKKGSQLEAQIADIELEVHFEGSKLVLDSGTVFFVPIVW